jgi:hypothetical protein
MHGHRIGTRAFDLELQSLTQNFGLNVHHVQILLSIELLQSG